MFAVPGEGAAGGPKMKWTAIGAGTAKEFGALKAENDRLQMENTKLLANVSCRNPRWDLLRPCGKCGPCLARAKLEENNAD